MKLHTLAIATVAVLGSFTSLVHAAGIRASSSPASFVVSSSPSADSITISFTDLNLQGYEFSQLFGSLAGPVYGTLTGVSVNATLSDSVDYVWASDLTLYVVYPPLDFDGLLQVGSVGDLGAAETIFWANGDDSLPGTTLIDSVTLGTPLTFVGNASDPDIWLGNGYSFFGDEEGTWSGSITLQGLSLTAAIPEPESISMFLAGGAGLLAFMARRRRRAAHTA
jgi:hypothetical protein